MSSFTSSKGPVIESFRYHDEEFNPDHLPFDKIDMPALREWAKAVVSGQGISLYFLIHINPQETEETTKHYWIFVMANVMHERFVPFKEGELWAKAFDVTETYQRGFRGVTQEGAKVDYINAVEFSQFQMGRLYQASDEAARSGNLRRLETLVLEMCQPDAECLGFM
ncbi:uncharacterized protein PV09_04611 [Verruconis gallopava]|uniref:Uncharacterized protein n=1 Tax=Verruconis gallopava TaxID=253628 RepID=A0A0D2AYS2_9PEZI|nr:uncharacterized protein PV09_04611 [Verruconis gallopava]KIW04319.1 hypothetical protein PV09_04611 [Verruconis gallopava]